MVSVFIHTETEMERQKDSVLLSVPPRPAPSRMLIKPAFLLGDMFFLYLSSVLKFICVKPLFPGLLYHTG
jgi:hypothetical protein